MKRTHKNKAGNTVENTNPKWVIARVHPNNDHFQFLRVRRGADWTNNASEAATFDSRWKAFGALSHYNFFDFMRGAMIMTI